MKTILKLHLTPVRTALITNRSDSRPWGGVMSEPLCGSCGRQHEGSPKAETEPPMAQVITPSCGLNARSQYLKFLFVCVCTYLCVYLCVSTHVCLCVETQSWLSPSIFILFIGSGFFFLLNLELTNSGQSLQPACQGIPELCLLDAGHTRAATPAQLFVGSGSPHTHKYFTHKPSPQPHPCSLWYCS